jgi:hypothetical protein
MRRVLKLIGVIADVKFDSVYLVPDEDSKKKLIRNDLMREEDNQIKLKCNFNVDDRLGYDVLLRVTVNPYSFASKLEHNKGVIITGTSLYIKSITKEFK